MQKMSIQYTVLGVKPTTFRFSLLPWPLYQGSLFLTTVCVLWSIIWQSKNDPYRDAEKSSSPVGVHHFYRSKMKISFENVSKKSLRLITLVEQNKILAKKFFLFRFRPSFDVHGRDAVSRQRWSSTKFNFGSLASSNVSASLRRCRRGVVLRRRLYAFFCVKSVVDVDFFAVACLSSSSHGGSVCASSTLSWF